MEECMDQQTMRQQVLSLIQQLVEEGEADEALSIIRSSLRYCRATFDPRRGRRGPAHERFKRYFSSTLVNRFRDRLAEGGLDALPA
jgi:hypothetical protein